MDNDMPDAAEETKCQIIHLEDEPFLIVGDRHLFSIRELVSFHFNMEIQIAGHTLLVHRVFTRDGEYIVTLLTKTARRFGISWTPRKAASRFDRWPESFYTHH